MQFACINPKLSVIGTATLGAAKVPAIPVKLFFAKTLSKIACQAPKPPNSMIPNELPTGQFPLQNAILK
jgi:hypothetical protein